MNNIRAAAIAASLLMAATSLLAAPCAAPAGSLGAPILATAGSTWHACLEDLAKPQQTNPGEPDFDDQQSIIQFSADGTHATISFLSSDAAINSTLLYKGAPLFNNVVHPTVIVASTPGQELLLQLQSEANLWSTGDASRNSDGTAHGRTWCIDGCGPSADTPVPEPSTLSAVGIGTVAFLSRYRRR